MPDGAVNNYRTKGVNNIIGENEISTVICSRNYWLWNYVIRTLPKV